MPQESNLSLISKRLGAGRGDAAMIRIHFIEEWAERRGLKQADICRALDVDKSTVSRWFDGVLPQVKHLEPLAELFEVEPNALFRHPDDDWLARFFKERDEEERARIKATLEAAFPRKVA